MIRVIRDTWNCDKGFTKKVYKLEENKEMKLIKNNQIYAIQVSDFHNVEKDWNCDNDIYELYGAYFDINGYNDFLTPEDIVSMIIDDGLEIVYNK